MKKILILTCLLTGIISNAQNEKKSDSINTRVIYLESSASVGSNLGVSLETTSGDGNSWIFPKLKQTRVYKFFYSTSTLTFSSPFISDVDGSGWSVELGSKTYFNQDEHKGFYFGNYLMFGNLEFDEENHYDANEFEGDGKFYGKYRYFSFISPEIGFKFLIANTVAVNLHIGGSWIIEFGSKGDVSNKSFDNIKPRLGLSLGYNF